MRFDIDNLTAMVESVIDDSVLAAETAHEVNRAYCRAIGDTTDRPAWADLDDEARFAGVECVVRCAAMVTLDKDMTAESQHKAWCTARRMAGWTHGEKIDRALKTHPCLVDYENLPAAERVKDNLFIAVVRSVLHV